MVFRWKAFTELFRSNDYIFIMIHHFCIPFMLHFCLHDPFSILILSFKILAVFASSLTILNWLIMILNYIMPMICFIPFAKILLKIQTLQSILCTNKKILQEVFLLKFPVVSSIWLRQWQIYCYTKLILYFIKTNSSADFIYNLFANI